MDSAFLALKFSCCALIIKHVYKLKRPIIHWRTNFLQVILLFNQHRIGRIPVTGIPLTAENAVVEDIDGNESLAFLRCLSHASASARMLNSSVL